MLGLMGKFVVCHLDQMTVICYYVAEGIILPYNASVCFYIFSLSHTHCIFPLLKLGQEVLHFVQLKKAKAVQ